MTTILGYVGDLATTMFSTIGNALITFLTASGHEIALIPIAAWLLVLCVGGIRRLIKGV